MVGEGSFRVPAHTILNSETGKDSGSSRFLVGLQTPHPALRATFPSRGRLGAERLPPGGKLSPKVTDEGDIPQVSVKNHSFLSHGPEALALYFSRITIFTPALAHLSTIFIEAWGMATQPAVYFLEPVQCRKMQLPLPGVPSAL